MNVLAPQKHLQIGHMSYTTAELSLIRRTVAKDANDDEFSQFILTAARLRLDPLRKQIYCFIFHKDKPNKRQMTLVTAIGGLRAIADRTGNYRPDDQVPRFTYDETLKSDINPAGLVKAEVTVYKHVHGGWWPVPGEARWDAYAPLIEQWAEDEQTGKRAPTGKRVLDPGKARWRTDPEGMLAKCAESGAIRKAWPDDTANLYEQAEIDRADVVDLTPAEYAEQASVENRLERIQGANTILFDFLDDTGIAPVPIGKIADRIDGFLKEHPSEAEYFAERNRHSLKEFWARSPSDALEVKKMLEKAVAEAPAQ